MSRTPKLTDEQIQEVVDDPRSQIEIAIEYGVSQSYVSMLKRMYKTGRINLLFAQDELSTMLDALAVASKANTKELTKRRIVDLFNRLSNIRR